MPLSDIQVRNLKPRDKAYKASDFEGLFVLVKPNGSKLWQFKYRLDGKERLLSIGVYLRPDGHGKAMVVPDKMMLGADGEVDDHLRGPRNNGQK